jgi:predicted phosphodiesterase
MSQGQVRRYSMIISDVHTRYEVINKQIRHAESLAGTPPEQVFVLGDFGFFHDELHDWFRRGGNRFLRPVFCVEGNHEDHADLDRLTEAYADVVTHQPRGSLVLLGRWGGLCLGGARYMDAGSTPRGSEITRRDISKCLSHGVDEVDLVLTHDCPAHIKVPNTPGLEHYGATGVPEMAELAEFFQPRFWFFGHHHRWFERTLGGTRYVGLPQGWNGFVLLDDQANCQRVDNQVEFEKPRWWRRLF